MADQEKQIKARLVVEDELSPAMKKAIDNMQHMHSESINLAAGLEIIKTVAEGVKMAFEFVEAGLDRAVEAALKGEVANNKLTGALVSAGFYTDKNVESLEHYITTVSKATGANEEQLKSIIGQSIQMGLSVEKAQQMEEATRKLAAATGDTLEGAFAKMRASLAGHARGLAMVLPQVKELSSSQLKQGDAIAIVNDALTAQYQLYQGSVTASLEKAKTATEEVYKSIGNIIIQSPVTQQALKLFVDYMYKLQDAVMQADKWIKQNWDSIVYWTTTLGKAIAIVGGFLAVASGLPLLFTAIGTAITFMTGPIGIAIIAVGALTVALNKWPGLFDMIVGGLKSFVGFFLQGFSMIADGYAKIARLLHLNTIADGLEAASAKLKAYSVDWKQAGEKQIEAGIVMNQTKDIAVAAHTEIKAASNEALLATSAHNAALKEHGKIYAEFINIGTLKQREALQAQVDSYNTDTKEFEKYLQNKITLAVSKADEQEMELDKIRAKASKGSGTSAEKEDTANLAVDAEVHKQAELNVLHKKGILDDEDYHKELLASQQRSQQAELDLALSGEETKAKLLGNSPEGFALKQQIEQQQFQLKMQQKIASAQEEGATEAEVYNMKLAAEQEFNASMVDEKEKWITQDMQQNEKLHNNWQVTLDKIKLSQEKFGTVMGTLRGVQQTEEYKGTMGALSNLSTLRESHSKGAFEVGKKAAIAEATVKTFMSATEAFAAMAGIPIVGPALGAIAAGAAIAAGFVQIQKINAQKFTGGQGDEGMDYIPQQLDGKSFQVSGGERIVQPEANKSLTNFLDKEKKNEGGKGSNYTLNLTYNGMGGEADARKMSEMVVKQIRLMSERGEPILNEKGLIKNE